MGPHVVPPLSLLSLTWALPTFTALFPTSRTPAILFPVEEKKEVLPPAAVPSAVNSEGRFTQHTSSSFVTFLTPAPSEALP